MQILPKRYELSGIHVNDTEINRQRRDNVHSDVYNKGRIEVAIARGVIFLDIIIF